MFATDRWVKTGLLFLGLLLLSACGGGGGSSGTGSSATPVLAGDSAQSASAALQDMDAGPVDPSNIVQGHLLTRLFVGLKVGATVGQVNAAAATVGATAIAFSASKTSLLTLQIPRQAGIGDLHGLADTLRAQPGILFALPAREFKTSVLPEVTPGQPVSPLDLSHLRPTRFPQAWNARGAAPSDCLPRSVNVYIWDKFGDSNSRPAFFTHIDSNNFVFDDVGGFGDVSGHGFDVAMTLGGKFDAQKPTGANPFKDCLIIHEIEAFGRDFASAMVHAWETVSHETDSRFILNISLNFPNPLCGPNGDQLCDAQTILSTPVIRIQDEIVGRVMLADMWTILHSSSLELNNNLPSKNLGQRMLITLSAGNIEPGPGGFLANEYLGFHEATFASPVSLATELGDVRRLLTNIFAWRSVKATFPDFSFSQEKADSVVNDLNQGFAHNGSDFPIPIGISAENLQIVRSVTSGETLADVRESVFNFNAPTGRIDIKAVGEDISLPDAPAVPIEAQEGTSFAAPQVAGLASYLWVLDDGLRNLPVRETIQHMGGTTRSNNTTPNNGTAFKVMDAYGAVLALDARNGTKNIRKALLDVNDDGVFDHLDLVKFQEAYQLTDPNRPTIPSARDYSRFDLNGDGYTGGIIIAPFDLDVSGTPAISTVDEEIEGYQITFNEAALSDIQILCFYAYSDLYQVGQQNDPRSTVLGIDNCVGVQITAVLPAQITTSASLDVTVEVPVANGQFAPAPNMLVNFTPTCATVNPISGRTDANGAISTTVTPSTGCTSVSVNAVTSVDVGTTPLAQQTVTASVSGATVVLTGQVTLHSHKDFPLIHPSLFEDTVISAFVTVEITRVEVDGNTVTVEGTVRQATGTGTRTEGADLTGCNRPPEVDSGNVIGGSIKFGFPAFPEVALDLDVSGTSTSTTCTSTTTSTFLGNLKDGKLKGTATLSNGSITAIDFNRTTTVDGRVTVTTGLLQ